MTRWVLFFTATLSSSVASPSAMGLITRAILAVPVLPDPLPRAESTVDTFTILLFHLCHLVRFSRQIRFPRDGLVDRFLEDSVLLRVLAFSFQISFMTYYDGTGASSRSSRRRIKVYQFKARALGRNIYKKGFIARTRPAETLCWIRVMSRSDLSVSPLQFAIPLPCLLLGMKQVSNSGNSIFLQSFVQSENPLEIKNEHVEEIHNFLKFPTRRNCKLYDFQGHNSSHFRVDLCSFRS